MIDLGMPTLLEFGDINECAELCRELDLSFVELNMCLPQYEPDAIDAEYFRKIAGEYGIYYTIHLDDNINVSDFNRTVAEAYFKVISDSIKAAKAVSAPSLNMHLSRGGYFTLPEGKVNLFDIYREYYLDSMRRLREECEKEIGGEEIKICVENTSGYTGFQLAALDILLESEVFALTYDIGHDYCAGGEDGEVIMSRAEKLRHFHIHDAAGKRNHLPLGEGELDLNKYFALAKKHGCRAVIEVKTAESLKRSVNLIRTGEIQL